MAAAVVQHAAESELFVAGERARRRQASDATVSSSGLGRAWEAAEPGCSSAIAGGLKTGSGPYGRASSNETAVTREDFSSPLGAFLTQIPKPDSKRVPPKLFS